ncbi:hypothetical protein RintRC_6088 [Richelia intracellularis]|nr:hypothetical protein RintRC_6088 [Richelia intracellularis]
MGCPDLVKVRFFSGTNAINLPELSAEHPLEAPPIRRIGTSLFFWFLPSATTGLGKEMEKNVTKDVKAIAAICLHLNILFMACYFKSVL